MPAHMNRSSIRYSVSLAYEVTFVHSNSSLIQDLYYVWKAMVRMLNILIGTY